MRQQGFLDVMSSLISEMKRYLIAPEILFEKANALTDNKTLKNKLIALSNVLEKYLSYVEESGCTDSEDDLFYLANRIENGTEFDENTYIWVNRFDKFMPQQICVLEALLKKGVHMTISVCCPVTEYENEREIYLQTEKTVQKVYELSQTYGLENEYTASDGLRHLKGKDDLYKLFRYWTEDFVYPTSLKIWHFSKAVTPTVKSNELPAKSLTLSAMTAIILKILHCYAVMKMITDIL